MAGPGVSGVITADFNGDGKLDLAIAETTLISPWGYNSDGSASEPRKSGWMKLAAHSLPTVPKQFLSGTATVRRRCNVRLPSRRTAPVSLQTLV
jgi:hypothetical protein